MSSQIFARQGDLVIDRLESPIKSELAPTDNLVLAGSTSGHYHRLLGGCTSRRDGAVTLVRITELRELVHEKPDGHRTITLSPGDYSVRPLRERGDSDDRAVED